MVSRGGMQTARAVWYQGTCLLAAGLCSASLTTGLPLEKDSNGSFGLAGRLLDVNGGTVDAEAITGTRGRRPAGNGAAKNVEYKKCLPT